MKKYFYEKSEIRSWPTNITYGELMTYDSDQVSAWLEDLRTRVLKDWNDNGQPPIVGKDESEIVRSFSRLRQVDASSLYFELSTPNDPDVIGVVSNFTKNATACNQFFPTMLKTKISTGLSSENALSIYDHFTDPLKEKFHHTMKRTLYNDSMYTYSKSILSTQIKNPYFREGETLRDFFTAFKNGDGRFDGQGLRISKISCTMSEYQREYTKYLTIKADEIREFLNDGLLERTMITYLGEVEDLVDHFHVKKDSSEPRVNVYLIKAYEKNKRIFPSALQTFRLSLGQPAVNFPPMTAKFLYEHFTMHIPASEKVHVYDPSSGWGGRILGAMSVSRPIHYVGTDPNTDNFIPELGVSRYEYLADFYLRSIGEKGNGLSNKFFQTQENHTYEVFQDGSELIGENPEFHKYRGKLDFVFTSPPYFNREQYSDDETQSFKAYGQYSDWRDNFLRPTLTTAVEYLKRDRYLCWNIANIKVSANKVVHLEEDSISILKELGMEYKGKIGMLMAKMIGNSDIEALTNKVWFKGEWWKIEPIFVFYKP
jgi:hypothetical protein